MFRTPSSFGTILSFPEERPDATVSCPSILTERRSKFRYPMELGIRFRFLLGGSPVLSGAGRTLNLSAGGVLVVSQDIASHDEIGAGARVEISIGWPVLLEGRIPLQLFAIGQVVRREAIDFAATFHQHEFRTMRTASLRRARLGADLIPWPRGKIRVLD
jgi:hypothetical protein